MATTSQGNRKLTIGSQGYFCVSEDGHPTIQGKADREGVSVWVGCDTAVTIDKMFGPLVFWPVRVRADRASCEWVIEREFGPVGEWREVARIPGQLETDFTDFSA
jgi:hypothetical protein